MDPFSLTVPVLTVKVSVPPTMSRSEPIVSSLENEPRLTVMPWSAEIPAPLIVNDVVFRYCQVIGAA